MVLLKAQLSDLSGLVRAQQRTIEQQQNTIDSLKSQETRHPLLMSGGEAAGWRSNSMAHPRATASTGVSPFDSQRIGIGDRRMLGLFDSRFHSTSRYVSSSDCTQCVWPKYVQVCSQYYPLRLTMRDALDRSCTLELHIYLVVVTCSHSSTAGLSQRTSASSRTVFFLCDMQRAKATSITLRTRQSQTPRSHL